MWPTAGIDHRFDHRGPECQHRVNRIANLDQFDDRHRCGGDFCFEWRLVGQCRRANIDLGGHKYRLQDRRRHLQWSGHVESFEEWHGNLGTQRYQHLHRKHDHFRWDIDHVHESYSQLPTINIGDGATLSVNPAGSANLTLTAGQSIAGTGATGTVITGNATGNGVITTSNTTISSTGTLTFNRLEIRGTGNQITGGNIISGVNASRRGLIVGNTNAGTLTITGGTLTSIGGSVIDLVGANGGAGTFIIDGGSYVNTANSGRLNLGLGGTSSTFTINSGSAEINTLEIQYRGGECRRQSEWRLAHAVEHRGHEWGLETTQL